MGLPLPQLLTSIATVSLSGSLRDKLQAISAAGFDGVELFENDLLTFDGNAAAVQELARTLGLEILVFQPFRDFEGMPEPQRSRAFDRAERKFDLMQELGTELVLVCSNVSPASLGGLDRAAEDLHELSERAASRGLRVGFEALSWGRHISDYRDAWEVVRRADHPSLGMILDSFHILAPGLDPSKIATIPPEKIFLVQIADAPLLKMDVLSWSRHFRCFPGQGRLPLSEFMSSLAETRYRGALSLEVFNDQFRAASPQQVALDGRRSLTYLLEQLPEPEAPAAIDNGQIPPPPEYAGIEFLEFAVNEESAPELELWLAALGFRRWGRHRSKAVEVWKQGDIHLVINAEPEGFAHSYNLIHGTSVCAVALRVNDAQQAERRAQAYRFHSFRQPIGPGEVLIPAIHGVEDSLLYFVDDNDQRGSIWELDFELEEVAEVEPAGLRNIDHISQVIPFGRLLSWILFYRAVFGLQAGPEVDVADPGGLIHSQVVESAGGRVRIVVNGSQSQGTVAGRFVSDYLGGGLQHIALETRDIVETLSMVTNNGLQVLPIPQNYYDDVSARFGLSDEEIERLRSQNVLYDRSDQGEFFHAYTRSLSDHIFFEFVQRRGYQGFGAANAPIRLAAQQRLAQTPFQGSPGGGGNRSE